MHFPIEEIILYFLTDVHEISIIIIFIFKLTHNCMNLYVYTMTLIPVFSVANGQVRPSKVQGVTVTRTVQGSSPALRVSWSAVSGSGITYTVCYSTTSGTQSDPPSNADCGTSGITGTSTTLGPLSRGTTYYIWVAAVSSGGRGPYSDRRQSITYNGMPFQVT